MKHLVTRTFAGLTLFAIALLCAFFAMRVAIHGREVAVPNLSGKSDAEAAALTKELGLNLSVENRFYSPAAAPNHVLSQSPVAGARVRRGWQVRVTESLGGQKVEVPDLTSQSERAAGLVLRRIQLELGAVARLPASGEPGVVLGQSPPPNTAGLNGPQVSLLVSDADKAADSASFVMPTIVGMTLANATARLAAVGLHIGTATQPSAIPAVSAPTGDSGSAGVAPGQPSTTSATPPTAADPALQALTPGAAAGMEQAFDVPITPPPPADVNASIVSQSPAPGHRISRSESIRVMVGPSPTGTPPL